MRFLIRGLCLMLGVLLWMSSTARADSIENVTYKIADIGTFSNSASVKACSVNDYGEVVGISTNAQGVNTAFYYETNRGMISILNSNAQSSAALSINNQSQIVGNYVSQKGNKTPVQYSYMVQGVAVTNIHKDSNVYSVNNSGQVVGSTTAGKAFLWTEEDGKTNLGNNFASAAAISDTGVVVGQTNTQSGYVLNLETGDSAQIAGATMTGISDSGSAIGYTTASDGTKSSFVWNNGAMTTISGFEDNDSTIAYAVNNNGVVVGSSDGAAFAWSTITGAIDLTSLLSADSGWDYLVAALDINNLGQIVGWGIKDGQTRAFLLTRVAAPEAPMILLALISLIFIGWRYRQMQVAGSSLIDRD